MTNYKELFGSYLGYISTNAVKFTSNITQFVRPMLNNALTKLKTTKLADYLVYLGGVAAAGLAGAYIWKDQLLHKAAAKGYSWVIKPLIAFGANVDATDALGNTPLHQAAEKGELWKAKLLIAFGANVDAKNNDNKTPLHLAARNEDLDAITVLVEAGAKVDVTSNAGKKPIDLTSNAEVKALLEEALRERADNEAAHAADAEVDGAIEVSLEFKGSELNYSEYENLQTKHQPSSKGFTDEVSSDSNDGYAQAAGLVQKASDDLQEV